MSYSLATRLERAVKNSGLNYKKVSGWASRGHGAMGTIQSVMCHHTAGPASGNTPSLNVVTHGRPGLSGPLAQLFLARDGTPYLVAAGRAYHAGRVSSGAYQNSHSIGIEAEATGTSSWPAAQIEAYARLCRALVREFGLPTSRVVGHKEKAVPHGRKIDPNFSMSDFRKKVNGAKGGVGQGSSAGGGGSSKTYTVVSATAPLGLYDKDGDGRTRVKDWQTDALGYGEKTADGYFGPDTEDDTRDLQRQIGVTADGLVGDDTTAAWEKAGKPKLKKESKSKPSPARPKKSRAKLTVDGKWGAATTKALQQILGTPVDGKVSFQPAAYKSQNPGLMTGWKWTNSPRSSNVIEALQGKLGVSKDGRIGPNTIEALQRKLKTPVDGRVSRPSTMVRELQRNLNAGKLW